jgi:hypothetical protein
MNLVSPIPWSRINDQWVRTSRVDARPAEQTITHPLISNRKSINLYADFYSNIALDIVTETAFHYPYPYISEKTLRPVVSKRMFIILGPANTLKTLHNKGFETFGDFINEDYDSIHDPEERFLLVVQEIERFCQHDLSKIKQYYLNNQQKFEHNSNRLSQLHQEELKQLKLTLSKNTHDSD